jgi:GNAT superfamily N-acetyltransferase
VPVVLELIRALAAYEREPDAVAATPELLHAALFGPDHVAFAHLAVDDGGDVVGFALWFRNFSTWTGRPGIYLEDLFVRPEARGKGYGKALLTELARICVAEGYGRFEWAVLDWNKPSIDFYTSLGAEPMSDWTIFRLSGEPLRELGAGTPTGAADAVSSA